MDGGTSAIPRATALDAPEALAEGKTAPFGRIHAAGDEDFVGIADGADAVFADGADQALGQDAVQRGDEVVGFDAHIEESAEDVDNVVGMDGGEDEVAGKGGIDGDLRGFLVADFANKDLVGVVAQDGTQTTGEGQ